MAGQKQITTLTSIPESDPLTPMQQGIVSLPAPHSGVDIGQVSCTLPEEINISGFRQAWERVVERHAVLRTGFLWDGLQIRQEVHGHVRLHLEQKDWRGLRERAQRSRLDAYLKAERRRGFELSVPPLMRLALFHVGEAKHILAWTFHHLLLDSPALVALLNEVFDLYEAFCQGRDWKRPPPPPERDDIEWSQIRDWSADVEERRMPPTVRHVEPHPGGLPAQPMHV